MTAGWQHIGRSATTRGAPFAFQKQLAARLVAVGCDPRTAEALAELRETGAQARNAHSVIDACDAAGARPVIVQALRSGLSAEQVASLLRAAGAREGRAMSPEALDAVREALTREHYSKFFQRRSVPAQLGDGRHGL